MKSILKMLGVVLFASFVFTACSKDDDPADNRFFVGTYNGKVTYTGEGDDVSNTNGSVTVVKGGSATTYNFKFSDGIPDINNVEFRQSGDNTWVSTGELAGLINVTNNKLVIGVTKNGNTWTADCNR